LSGVHLPSHLPSTITPPAQSPPPAPVAPLLPVPPPELLDAAMLVVPTPPLHAVAPMPTDTPSSPSASSARATILEADRELARELSTR